MDAPYVEMTVADEAPGAPGIDPTWCSSAKEAVGCGLGTGRLWFTVGGGIVNEVYFPRVDIPQIRDLGFIVADDRGFWVEVKRLGNHELRLAEPGVPAVAIVHRHPRFTLALRITPDPQRDVLLIELRLDGEPGLRPYALLAPHLGGSGHDNVAAVGRQRYRRVLWAEQGPFGLALAAVDEHQRDAWGRVSAGYVGMSDGWQDFHHNGAMRWEYARAGAGNVALIGELPTRAVLALGIGTSKEAAATLAISTLLEPFERTWQQQLADWRNWHARCNSQCAWSANLADELRDQYLTSAMVLRVHQDKTYPGASVASLSIPWGNTRDERGGYHLVWPRDLVECAGALLAIGGVDEARDILRYLIATQHDDGHWFQNQWLGGKPYWQGVQLDEAAFPVLLAAQLAERQALDGIDATDMVRRALGFVARTGPASDQDRWEEDAGINAFTVAVCIAALVSGADWLPPAARAFALDLADFWNAQLERWTVARDTPLARRVGVPGYYIRVAPAVAVRDDHALSTAMPIKNRAGESDVPADEQVGVDFLQLVRFGLRDADDPLIAHTLKVIDDLLKVDTPSGPAWHRYNGDGYGEHDDGSPFDGIGRGRAWPLLTGERGHHAIAAGGDARVYLDAMAAMTGTGGLLPEQVWDREPLPGRDLYPGRPSGSAMPLAWAHAEFIKLLASRKLGRPFDRPEAVWQRYRGRIPTVQHAIWLPRAPVSTIPAGADLEIGLLDAGVIHWGLDDWRDVRDVATNDTGLGVHRVRLSATEWRPGQTIRFTYRDTAGNWAGQEFAVRIQMSGPDGATEP